MCRVAARSVILLVVLLLPSLAYSQAAITGVVRDTSGAILPGATVEASSPALIEKVRSVVTDGSGQYRIVALPPGTYALTFTLPGFSTVRREGVELSGTFVATINGDLRVGALEETITVTGETPIVDVQSAKTQQILSKEVLAAIPTSRLSGGIVALIPGVVGAGGANNVGGVQGMQTNSPGAIYGGRDGDSRTLSDGLSTAWNGGAGGMYMTNVAGAQEVVISTSGGLGEAETAGLVLNVIQRDGSNSFSGSIFFAGANGAMQGNNYTQELKDRGLTAPANVLKVYDFNPMWGGRIIRDRLWFYMTGRLIGAHNTVPGMYFNKNAGNVDSWTYEPDLSRQAFSDAKWGGATGRITWQASPKNKFNFFWDEQFRCDSCLGGGTATTSPEASGKAFNHPSHVQQVTWSMPATSRILLEAGYGTYFNRFRTSTPRKDFNPLLIQATEQAGSIPNLNYRAPASFNHSWTGTNTWRASVSYVTGAHNMKFGYFGGFQMPLTHNYWFQDITNYRFSGGVANRFTMQASNPFSNQKYIIPTSLYAQDQWTVNKLTMQGGVRYDHMVTTFPEQRVGGTRFVPVARVYAANSVRGVHFDDITPRMGAAYDLFGNGKTAIKVNLGKYPVAQLGSGDLDLAPLSRLSANTTRSWTDTNKNYVPDCNLLNPAKNGECGANADQNFAKDVFSTTFDPDVTEGWSHREYNWEFGTTVQHELIPGLSLTVGYHRRWYGNFLVTDNRAVGPSDFDPFNIVLAPDSRLPDGGGQTITDLYDLKPAKFGLVDNYRTAARKFGKQTERWNGVDVTLNARLRNVSLRGGVITGRAITDNCDVVPKIDSPSRRFCRVEEPFSTLTQVRGFGSYTIPRADVQVSATWQSNPGPQLAANYNAPNAVVAPSLGRSLSGGANTAVNLVGPGTLYGDRLYQLDFRFAKIVKFGRTRTQIGADLYNATNSSVPLTYNQAYVVGGAWLTPTTILPARFFKVSAQFDF